MKKCPNCDREAVRTGDWSCQWCGYPLMSGSYKKIDKTFRELREKRLPPQPVMEKLEAETIPEPEPELILEAEPEQMEEPEPVLEAEPELIPEPEPALEPEPKLRRKPVAKRKTAAKSKTATAAKAPKSTAKSKTATKAKAAPAVEAGPAPVDIEITVDELLAAYDTEGEAADARFANQTLKMTGVAERIEIKDTLDIYYITLNTVQEKKSLQSVRCVFDKQHAPELSQLVSGQTVTVQGKYDGSVIDLSLRDCFLVG